MTEISTTSPAPVPPAPNWPQLARSNTGLLVAGVISAVIGGAAIRSVWSRDNKTNPCATATGEQSGFGFSTLSSTAAPAMCEGNPVTSGTLSVGTKLEVGESPIEMQLVAMAPSMERTSERWGAGSIKLDNGSEVSLVATSNREHRLALHCGRLHSRVIAQPRLFVVEVFGANAIDLGSSYTLSVNRKGAGVLQVETGSVELSSKSGMVIVNAGQSAALAATSTGIHVGPAILSSEPAALQRQAQFAIDNCKAR